MAPVRRYLRITQFSVLEVRIYLDNPSLASSWLLHPRNPILPRVIDAVKPLVLPKLKEENARERSKAKGRKKGVKDVVIEDDFEVSIFLTETSTRHSLLTKQKHFREKGKDGLKSNSNKLTGAGTSSGDAIQVEDAGEDSDIGMPSIPREDSDEKMPTLKDIPSADEEDDAFGTIRLRPKRRRIPGADEDDGKDGLFVDEEDEEPLPKRTKETSLIEQDGNDDKKKIAMDTSYDGFAIYGRVLCLVVKRREANKNKGISAGQAMMEEWITSTQMPPIEEDGP